MTAADIESHGADNFAAPKAKVFAAALGALAEEGHTIAVEDPARGIIATKPKLIRADAQARAVGSTAFATAVEYSRSYRPKIAPSGNATRVEAAPTRESADISSRSIWDLESPGGEYALWDQLFRAIERNL